MDGIVSWIGLGRLGGILARLGCPSGVIGMSWAALMSLGASGSCSGASYARLGNVFGMHVQSWERIWPPFWGTFGELGFVLAVVGTYRPALGASRGRLECFLEGSSESLRSFLGTSRELSVEVLQAGGFQVLAGGQK